MNSGTERRSIAGPAGPIECAIDMPPDGRVRGVVVLCHPHPQHGGTLDNKVVATLARAFVQLGYRSVRFNFRGIGASGGTWDEGRGEIDDALAVVAHFRDPALPLALGGFSFGAYVVSQAAARLGAGSLAGSLAGSRAERLVLIGPAAQNFDVAAVPADTIVIHGEADDVVPLAAVFDWARPQALPITVVPGAGHFFHGQLGLLKSLVIAAWHAPAQPLN